MIQFLEILAFVIDVCYAIVFFCMIQTFLPLRKNLILRIMAFVACNPLSAAIIYSNDLAGLLGTLLGFCGYVSVFHRGRWVEKLTAVLIFYPPLIAVNYLMMDIGRRCFFGITGAPSKVDFGWTWEQQLMNNVIYTSSLLLRLLFWIAAWRFLRKYLRQVTSNLTTKMWLIVDSLMLASFVAIFTIIYFLPENMLVAYPICGASIFSGFGCIYLVSYICNSMQTAYRAQELERQQAYYTDRMCDEERVRSIYHDLKNHLLILQAQAGNEQVVQESIQGLQNQIREYENYYHTGNAFLDILIRDKAKMAQKEQIDFSAVISFKDGDFMEPLDISTIFGNAIDNAIEASQKLPQEQRLITVRANRVRDMLMIIVENTVSSDVTLSKGTTKKDTFMHGFGLQNIRNAVQKYDGQCNTKVENGMFRLQIVMPID
ncbi:MAG: GHKL domain-containing protein [Lachnospiraceae bacterium]|nr:GHKL domain-containing protein [Lachnospiraceae bacterium]